VKDVFEPDEILWESLSSTSDIAYIKNKLKMYTASILAIALTVFMQILIGTLKDQNELEYPPLLCPPSTVHIPKDIAYLDSLSSHPKGLMNCFCLHVIKTEFWKAPFITFTDVDPQ
jgi:hypothetical protein